MGRGGKSMYTDKQWEWIVERYTEGYRVTELAGFLGVHRNTVEYHLREMGRYGRKDLKGREKEFLRLADKT